MNPEYFNTLFELREPIPELPKVFHIITAYNPMDEILSVNDNLMIVSCSSPNEVFVVDRFSKRLRKLNEYRSWQQHSQNGNDARNI